MSTTTTTDTSAYLPSVWKNAYRYDDISANSIVFKSSASSFGSIVAPAFGTDDAKPKVLQIAKGTADGTIVYQWVDPAAASLGNLENTGAVVSSGDGTIYDVEGMNNSNYWGVALKYSADNKYVAQPLTSIAGLTAANTTADANYYFSYTATTSTWASVALSTDTSVVKGGSFVKAVASNLFDVTLDENSNYLLIMTTSGYSAVSVPNDAGEYVISVDSEKKIVLAAATPDATGGNLVAAVTAFTSLSSDTTNVFNAFTTKSNYNYMVDFNMDIYVGDITKLVSNTLSDADFVNALPEVIIKVGSNTLGTYTVKTNQPLQTITMSGVIGATAATSGAITAEIKFNGVPTETADFIKIAKLNSVFGTYQSCGPTPSSP